MLTLAVLASLGCSPASTPTPTSTPTTTPTPTPPGPLGPPPGPQPAQPLSGLCGDAGPEPCLPLPQYLAKLRSTQCPRKDNPTPPKQSACGGFTVVDEDYGVVGYSRYFDANGALVAGVAHVYEHGTSQAFGPVPACTPTAPKPVCAAP
jgi:hypothetical protein